MGLEEEGAAAAVRGSFSVGSLHAYQAPIVVGRLSCPTLERMRREGELTFSMLSICRWSQIPNAQSGQGRGKKHRLPLFEPRCYKLRPTDGSPRFTSM